MQCHIEKLACDVAFRNFKTFIDNLLKSKHKIFCSDQAMVYKENGSNSKEVAMKKYLRSIISLTVTVTMYFILHMFQGSMVTKIF